MPQNIEVKSMLGINEFFEAIGIAKKIYNGKDKLVLYQTDTFFNTINGTRLKLRREKDQNRVVTFMLISYERPNVIGPKTSTYFKTNVPDGAAMLNILKHSCGVLGEVEKQRTVYIVERNGLKARVHLDEIVGVGEGIEFEVIVDSDDQLEAGNEFAEWLTKQFDLKEKNLVAGAYLDLILEEESMKKSAEKRDCGTLEASAESLEREMADATAKMREHEAAQTLATIITKESGENPKRARRSNDK